MKSGQASIRLLLTSAGLLASVHAANAEATLPTTATPEPTPSTLGTERSEAARRLDLAANLLADHKPIRARALVSPMLTLASLSDEERERAIALAERAARSVDRLDAMEFSIQSAEAGVEAGDLLSAERQARTVIEAPKATNEQSGRARAVLAQVETGRAKVTESLDALLDGAKASFEAGRTGECRESLRAIAQSGVALNETQANALATYQSKMVALAEAKMASAGMLQPGVVTDRNDPKQPEPAPAEPPAEPMPDQPAAQPAPPDAAQPAPAAEDPIKAVLRSESQGLLAEAEQAFNDRRLNEAQSKYARVKANYREFLTAEQLKMIDNRLAECRALLGAKAGQDTIIGDFTANRGVVAAETKAVFENLMGQANTSMDTGDWDQARNLAAQAMLKISQNRSFLAEAEFQALANKQRDLLASVSRREEAARAARKDEDAAKLAAEELARKETATQTKARKINESLSRIRDLQKEQKYEEALQVCDNVLFLDPINPSGLALKAVLEDVLVYTRVLHAKRKSTMRLAELSATAVEAMVAPSHIMEFPDDWAQLSSRRGSPVAFADSPENRRTLALVETKRTPVAFKDNSLADVLNFVQAVTQVNMDVDWGSLEAAGIDKDRQITLNLSNVPVKTVLDRIVEKASDDPTNGAAWAVYDGVLTIASREAINKNTSLQIYDIRDLLINVPNYTNAPEFDLQQALQSKRGGGGQSPFRDQGQNNQNNQGPTIEERQDELIKIVTENVDRDTWVENGGNVGKIQRFQGNLIVTQTPANHRAVDGLLSQLRAYRALQINVETRFLLVSQNWFEQIGLDLDVYFNARNNQVRAARGVAPQTQASDFFNPVTGGYLGGGAFTPTEMDVNRDGDTDDPNESGTLFAAAPSPLSPVSAAQNSLGLTEGLIGGGFATGLLQRGPALGIAGQFLDDIQVDFLVKATQADQRSVTLTAPRLTFTNGQISNIYVVTQTTFVSDLTPVTSDSAVGFDPDVDVLSEGVRMLVEGTVSADRRYVTLNVDAAIARNDRFRQTAVTAVAGGQLVSSASTSSFVELPQTTVTRVATTVTAPDQGTILMGGQRLITEQEIETGVPVLSKIPFLNRFFTNRIHSKEEQTLLILLKPTVIIQTEEEERSNPGLSEAIRTGAFGG